MSIAPLPRCLAIITARGGSKGVLGKNIKPLCGKPLISYAIETGLACPQISSVMVTTDSPEIRDVSLAAGAQVPFLRPAEIAGDTARQEDAILHAMDWCEGAGEAYDLICLLQPTSPLRRLETLEKGFQLLADHPEATGVLSVSEADYPPQFCNTLREDGTLKGFIPEEIRWANRQEVPSYYKISPLVALSHWQAFRETETFCHDDTLSLVVDSVEATDIDTPVDFLFTQWLLERGLRSSDDVRKFTELTH